MIETSMEFVWISGGFGLLFLGIGIWTLLRWHSLLARCTKRVDGIIEKTSTQRFDDASPTYKATVAYEVDGRTYRLTESFDIPLGREGKPVSVWIDPDNPSRSRMGADDLRKRLGYGSPGFGKLFVAAGVLSCALALLMRFAPNLLYDILHLPGDLIRRLKDR